MKRLLIIGASGHGKVVADIAKLNGYDNIAFLDDDESVKECVGYPVLGKSLDAEALNASEASDFFVAIGNSTIRKRIMEGLEAKHLHIITLIHPDAVIAENVHISTGSVIMAGVVINSSSSIGSGCIINTSSSVDHDNKIADYTHVSVGAHLAGTVTVGEHSWIGVGAVISNNLTICDHVTIGAGAVVIKNITIPGTYVGVPAVRIDK